MIWFDAILGRPVDDETLQRGVAAMLDIALDRVVVVHSISEIGMFLVTCVVQSSTVEDYSQIISIYSAEHAARAILESACRLAVALDRSMLLADDETANPYSFVHISNAGQHSVVLLDPDKLDEKDRYVIR